MASVQAKKKIPPARLFLIWMTQAARARTFVEVGSWNGRTAHQVLPLCPRLTMYLIDPLLANWNKIPLSDHDKRVIPRQAKNLLEEGGEQYYTCRMGRGERALTQEYLDELFERTLKALWEQHGDRAEYLRMTSEQAVKQFGDGSVDVIFVDAVHLYEYVKQDVELWWPKLRPGGLMFGDDCCEAFPGVEVAAREVLGDKVQTHLDLWFAMKEE